MQAYLDKANSQLRDLHEHQNEYLQEISLLKAAQAAASRDRDEVSTAKNND